MWNFVNISIENLFSHVSSVHAFNENVCTVISGTNDDIGMDNNGAGKSTLFEAIFIALSGTSFRDIDKEDFINYDAESCCITLLMQNEHLKRTMEIRREFFRGSKSSKVTLLENGKENVNLVSVSEVNKRIVELIGLSMDDVKKYFIIHQDQRYTFFTANDVEKKEVMNRITEGDRINPVIDFIDGDVKAKKLILNDFDLMINREIGLLQNVEENIVDLVQNDNIEAKKQELNETLFELEEKKRQNRKDFTNNITKIKGFENLLRVQQKNLPDLKKLRSDMESFEDEIRDGKALVKEIDLYIAGTIECPNCHHKFSTIENSDWTPKKAAETKINVEKLIAVLEAQVEKDQANIRAAKLKQQEMENTNSEIEGLEYNNKVLDKNLKTIENEIQNTDTEISELLQKRGENKRLNELKERKTELENNIKSIRQKQKEAQTEFEMASFWQFYMGKKGFMTYLANKSLKIIEGITNSYLGKMNTNLQVFMNGFKVLKSGEVREKIDCFISSDGLNSRKFSAFSGGEKLRVILAGIIGIQRLINLSADGKGLNFIGLDESLYGIDPIGMRNVIDVLNGLGITIYIVTQNIEEQTFENVLKSVKRNGISCYE